VVRQVPASDTNMRHKCDPPTTCGTIQTDIEYIGTE
jgi:hypothetical protein